MAAIDDLIAQVEDKALRERLRSETDRLTKAKKFGLVFEEHLPELTPIYSARIRKGSIVARRGEPLNDLWRVISVSEKQAHCLQRSTGIQQTMELAELVLVRQFGEPIFPALVPVDRVQNGADDAPWHTLIEADNYHALQLLEYLYAGKVDCIYIDPPYNTGARNWKYNNDFVDDKDRWRHSKWLAMMQRRLSIATALLTSDGVMIIAIDENEINHLVCLLEDKFPSFDIVTVAIVHNPRGNRTNNFAITHEYAVYLIPKDTTVLARTAVESDKPRKLRRWGHFSRREERRPSFYPVYVKNMKVIGIGEMPSDDFHPSRKNVRRDDGVIEIWPIDDDGVERRWNYSTESIQKYFDRIVIRKTKNDYLDLFLVDELSQPKTVWVAPELDAGGAHGSSLVEMVTQNNFPYPKSLYTEVRSIDLVVRDKPNAIVLDFFAGSGTTLNAVNLLNAVDGGSRHCIMVTNNEVGADRSKYLTSKGYQPGDQEWDQSGICQSVTWPRSKYTILGKRDDGSELPGKYLTGMMIARDKPRTVKQISFVDGKALDTPAKKKQLVALIDGIPQTLVKADSAFIVSEKHSASILFDEAQSAAWLEALDGQEQITDFYVVTSQKKTFDDLNAQIDDLLGPITINEEEKRPMSEGFAANLEYFRLDFLEKDQVALGRQFREILPLLWLRAGAIGPRPELPKNKPLPSLLLPEHNHFAVLLDETRFADFLAETAKRNDLTHLFLVTDSEEAFQEMAAQLNAPQIIQLYRDYLENFMINRGDEA